MEIPKANRVLYYGQPYSRPLLRVWGSNISKSSGGCGNSLDQVVFIAYLSSLLAEAAQVIGFMEPV